MFLSEQEIDDLQNSHEYAEFILDNYDPSERFICNGDTLLDAQEAGYLFTEFLMYRARKNAQNIAESPLN